MPCNVENKEDAQVKLFNMLGEWKHLVESKFRRVFRTLKAAITSGLSHFVVLCRGSNQAMGTHIWQRCDSIYHRIIESFKWEGEGHLVHLPCNQQAYLQLDQVAMSPIQPDLECLQGQGTYLSNLLQCFITLTVKKLFPISNLIPSSFNLKPFLLFLSQQILIKRLCHSFL